MRNSLLVLLLLAFTSVRSAQILLPMDEAQANHLKAYGITYWALQHGSEADWLLNYRGGSFSMPYSTEIEAECNIRGVSYVVLADGQYNLILAAIADPERNEDMVKLEKAPKICVYSPKTKQPWDDAVTLVLTYAEIPYEVVYDEEVLMDKLLQYDWLHLHHEDFTGQYGKFYASYRNAAWYQNEVAENETIAAKFGYRKVSELKLAVAKRIRDFVAGGGYLFAMCSATDTYDIALAAEGVDICDAVFDGDPMDPSGQDKLNFDATFAFQDFTISRNPFEYEHSNIDATSVRARLATPENDYFSLFEFSAKWDPIPTMLTQCHTKTIKGFYGQTTTFTNATLKPSVLVMGEAKAFSEARYIHGEFGYGM